MGKSRTIFVDRTHNLQSKQNKEDPVHENLEIQPKIKVFIQYHIHARTIKTIFVNSLTAINIEEKFKI